jgi:hypothetical protein
MKYEGGGLWATAAVLGIAATVGISNTQPKPSEPASARKAAEPPAHANTPAMKSLEEGSCADLEQRLQDFLLVDESEIVAPGSCYAGDRPVPSQKLLGQAKHMRFVIATLPDPLHSHFPLTFDRSAEAIQEAAQDDQYVYNSSKSRKTSRESFSSGDHSTAQDRISPSKAGWRCLSLEKSRRAVSIAANSRTPSNGSRHCNPAQSKNTNCQCRSWGRVSPAPFPPWSSCCETQLSRTPRRLCSFLAGA